MGQKSDLYIFHNKFNVAILHVHKLHMIRIFHDNTERKLFLNCCTCMSEKIQLIIVKLRLISTQMTSSLINALLGICRYQY